MNNFFSFDGRLNRLQYLINQVVIVLAVFLMSLLVGGMLPAASSDGSAMYMGILVLAVVVPALVASVWALIATAIKRLHDLGLTGYHVVWMMILSVASGLYEITDTHPLALALNIASLAVSLYMLVAPGEAKDNAYGPVSA